jgi:hypothetical protein
MEVVAERLGWVTTLLVQAGIHVVHLQGEGNSFRANGLENWDPPLV